MATVASATHGLYFEEEMVGRDIEWVKVVTSGDDITDTAELALHLQALYQFMSFTIIGTPKATGIMVAAEGIGATAAELQVAVRAAATSNDALVTIETLGGDAAGIAFA